MANGHRLCLACRRAQENLRRHPDWDFLATADRHYVKIMSSV